MKGHRGKLRAIVGVSAPRASLVSLGLLLGCGESGGGNYTRLMRAAASGEAHSVEAFLRAGEDPNARDARGNSALSLAAQFGRESIVTLLVGGGGGCRPAGR